MLRLMCCGLLWWVSTGVVLAQAEPETPAADAKDFAIATFDDLKALLDNDGVEYEANADASYAAIETHKGPINSVMVMRWAPGDGVLHFVQIMPIELQPATLNAVESAIVRMNHAYPVPGLGMNHDGGPLYFRVTLPIQPRGFITANEISNMFSYTLDQAALLFPTMQAVSEGNVAPQDALKYHNERVTRGNGPLGVWKREVSGSVWTLKIGDDLATELLRDDQVVVRSQATIEQDQITFNDKGGPLAVRTAGQYRFAVQADGAMHFESIDDASKSRVQLLTGGDWTR